MPPLRVLHVIPSVSPRDGGPTRAIDIIERALSKAGVEVTTLTTDHDLDLQGRSCASMGENGACRIYAHKWLDAYKVAPGLVPRLMRALQTHDVVHIHALFSFASTAAAWVAHRRSVPYVVRPLGTLSRYSLRTHRRQLKGLSMALVEKRILRCAAAVHFTSRVELEEAKALGLRMRSVVIPLGVDPDDASPPAPIAHPALAGRRVILFLSRLDPKKNVEALIFAIASSPMLRSSCALIIAGTGEPKYVASLKARAAAVGISDQTVWLGHIEGVQKRAALAAADVLVLPSLSENFGIAAIEALLAGVPCVLGEGVAVADEVEKAGAGFAVPPTPGAIAQALERMLGPDATMRRDMALRAKRVAEQKFSTRDMAQQLVALYEDLCGRGRRWNIERQ